MERIWFIANLAEVLDDRPDFSLVRMQCPPGDQPPLHVHADEDEGFYVLSGSLTLWAGAAEPVTLAPGEYALAPRGIPHTYRAGEEGAVVLVTFAPGSFVAFLREAGAPAARAELPVLDGPPDAERLGRIAAAHGITLLGPPGMLPGEDSPSGLASLGGVA
ncbi:cupin domain-containing protein [Solirubrobacter sp. CPCC 204708]|uniref:Cupin domain-containing protein n=1 Tax=Solirubrobacter deserti TaxID=2282478 RepID=A0ABT4RUZ7_9ACTN|nr:cupin domain-containing protein [Solirubrobacter deserti]MBE2316234.1 cupin domain-containing protein [Solirubrobacter deserti]MDA0142380.1 cupin domain-containing protein [Solirubrobacter deserti]